MDEGKFVDLSTIFGKLGGKGDFELSDLPGAHVRQFLTFKLNRLHAKLNAQAIDLLQMHAGIGLTQWRILSLIDAHRSASPSLLTQEAEIDKGLFSRTLKTLVDKGLVISRRDRGDRRRQFLELSAEGKWLVERTLPKMRARQSHLLSALSDEERRLLDGIVEKLDLAAEARDF